MNILVLATDYDGTLAEKGRVADSTIQALEKFRLSGRKIVLVTGRRLDELLTVFERVDLCDWVVVENGALLYCPRTQEKRLLAEPPPLQLVDALRRRGITSLAAGDTIIATWRPHEDTVE